MPRVNPPLPVYTGPVLRFRLFGVLLGQSTETTFLYMPTTAPAEMPDLQEFGDAFIAAVLDKYNSAVTADWDATKLRVDRFDDPTMAFVDIGLAGVSGDLVGDPAPSFVSMRIARNTDIAGQHGRGTLRIPGVVESSTAGNTLIGPQWTALGALADELLDDLATANPAQGSYRHCIATRYTTLPPVVTTTVNAAIVTTVIPNTLLGTSRSRMPRSTI